MKAKKEWIPRQHGAWFMLLVPATLGWLFRLGRPGSTPTADRERILLLVTWVVFYLIFNAISLMLKAAPPRRSAYLRPMGTYLALGVLLGLACVAVFGWRLLWWGILFLPLASLAFLLASMGRERSVTSGLITAAACSLFGLTMYSPDAVALLVQAHHQQTRTMGWIAIVCFLYFGGTVFSVKTLIRERGSQSAFLESCLWHILAVILAAAGVWLGHLPGLMIAFFCLVLLRAVALPLLGPMQSQPRHLKPWQIGLVEVALSLILVLIFLFTWVLPVGR